MKKTRLAAATVTLSLVSAACGGSSEPKAPAVEQPDESARQKAKPLPAVQQELGSIEQRDVERTFDKLQGALDRCHAEGRSRVEYLTGDVKVFLRIDQTGKVRWSYFEDSSLGDLETEKCILQVFSAAEWPKPEGGEAEVRHGFGWGPGGERAPTSWGPEKVMKAVDDSKQAKKDLHECKRGVQGDFRVTAYVEPDGKHGKFSGIGVAPPSKEAAGKVECVVEALKGLKLPSPGSYAAKVSFSL